MGLADDINQVYKIYEKKEKRYILPLFKKIADALLERKLSKILEDVLDKDIFKLSNEILSILNSGTISAPNVRYGKGYINIDCADSGYNVEFLSRSNMFIIHDEVITFEVYPNIELYGKRMSIWKEIQPEIKQIYAETIKQLAIYLVKYGGANNDG